MKDSKLKKEEFARWLKRLSGVQRCNENQLGFNKFKMQLARLLVTFQSNFKLCTHYDYVSRTRFNKHVRGQARDCVDCIRNPNKATVT